MQSAEVTALSAALAMPPPAVVAAAAGTILDNDSRSEVSDAGLVVWLRLAAETIEARSAAGEHRPWPDEDRTGWIERTVDGRRGLYEEVADLILDADTTSPDALASQIIGELGGERAKAARARRG